MKIPVIVGPTSSGKTSLALKFCEDLGGEVISADSRQIYKYMDVGTGKIPVNKKISYEKFDNFWILDGVKIWGYDVVKPNEYFSVYDFAKFSLEKASELREAGVLPVVAGGTGLYIDFFTRRIKNLSGPPDFELRKRLESKSLDELQKEVTSLNIELNRSDFHNKYRLVRALEREKSDQSPTPLPYLNNVDFVFLGLTADRDYLYNRVDNWVEEIWHDNLIIEEVKNLISLGFENSPKLSDLVYKSACEFYQGKRSREESIQRTQYNLHAYVRRQQTYFNRNSEIEWFNITQDNLFKTLYNNFKGPNP